MPFKSRRQWAAAMGGHIPGISKREAHEWAHETKDYHDLPERAPAEKGKPTLRSKKAAAEAAVDALEQAFATIAKTAALGASTMNPRNVGKLKGMMTQNALKTPGYAASQQAMNPRRNVISAMNFGKPH